MGQKSFGQILRECIYPKPVEIELEKTIKLLITTPITKYYQSENAKETVAIIEDPDGSISIGFARAGRSDTEANRITSKDGIDIAEGRARKARKLKIPLIEKNYVRGIYLPKIDKYI